MINVKPNIVIVETIHPSIREFNVVDNGVCERTIGCKPNLFSCEIAYKVCYYEEKTVSHIVNIQSYS